METPRGDAPFDLPRAEPELQQLIPGYRSVLLVHQRPDRRASVSVTCAIRRLID